jgi:hypothetical protein
MRGSCTAYSRQRIFDHQARGGDQAGVALLERFQREAKRLWVRFASGHVFRAGDVQKCWSEPSGI